MRNPSCPDRVGTFVVADVIWENQTEELREKFWTRILKVTWDKTRYWITAESILFDPIKPDEVIPDYEIHIERRRGRKDLVTVTRQRVAIAA